MREATTFSRILEMKLRFEIGRKLLRSSVDRDGFLRRGWIRACLNDDGKIPSERERLTRFVMIGPSSLKQSFKVQTKLFTVLMICGECDNNFVFINALQYTIYAYYYFSCFRL